MGTEPAARATYRLQLTPAFGFEDAARRLGYLARLGVTHAYLSPVTEAVSGSEHGYDVTDPTRLRAELGGEEGFAALVEAARSAGLGLLVDAVPNHMAADPRANPWWRDVLEDGEQSPYATWFDVEWHGPDPQLSGRVMVPVLGDPLGATLASDASSLAREGGGLWVRVPGTELPLGLQSAAPLLGAAAVRGESEEMAEIGAEAALLAPATTPQARLDRRAAREVLHARIAAVCAREPATAAALDEVLRRVGSDPARLRALVERQAWVLDEWRRGAPRLNHRRFFTIASLVGVRAELPEVREAGMRRLLGLVAEDAVAGLRIDHVDGLRDPGGYLAWLRQASGGAWTVVEKILAPGERLPGGWEADGTTGYEFAALLAALNVDAHGESLLEVLRDDLAGPRPEFAELAREAKVELLGGDMAAEWDRVRRRLAAVAEVDAALAAHPEDLREAALREVLVSLGVYRTYVAADGTASPADRAALHEAAARAAVAAHAVPPALLELVAARLAGEGWDPGGRCAELAAAVQQLSPALMAKGVEDTALYRDVAVLARNEVGSDPDQHPAGPQAFHAWCARAQAERPLGLLATSTHDTKRSEDVRARLCVLTGTAAAWAATARRWADRLRPVDPGGDALAVLLQTLVGAWPIDRDRLRAYLVKAMREAGERTSWTDPREEYEVALGALVDGALDDAGLVAEVEEEVGRLRPAAERLSLAWTLLRCTAPGVPDTHQGCELWDLSLVDPDNRRPVDWEARERLLESAATLSAAELLGRGGEGLPKLAVLTRALHLRRRRPELFGRAGVYRPLEVDGPRGEDCLAFTRGGPPGAVTVVPRLAAALEPRWCGTALGLPEGRWRDLLGGGEHQGGRAVVLDELLAAFPVALLERVDVPAAAG